MSAAESSLVSKVRDTMYTRPEQTQHDLDHLNGVHCFAKDIGKAENLSPEIMDTLEIAAVLHDIACPSLRERYGTANGKLQEKEGGPLTAEFLEDFDLPQEQKDRIVYLVAHHHTPALADGMDYQILLEADYIQNALESGYSDEQIRAARSSLFKTARGKDLLTKNFGI